MNAEVLKRIAQIMSSRRGFCQAVDISEILQALMESAFKHSRAVTITKIDDTHFIVKCDVPFQITVEQI